MFLVGLILNVGRRAEKRTTATEQQRELARRKRVRVRVVCAS